ncbi:hypothetical protein ACFC01_08385 [Streptomyces mirabilis]|uniref:hypothetical protein n=1 Tax=Streptomyces mirabilis TaxID=68239 RepID=UPI0035E2E4BF
MTHPIAHPIWIGKPGEDGHSGFTRYKAPSGWCCVAGSLDLPKSINAREATAFHEAGHTVLALVQGIHVPAVHVSTEPGTSGCAHPQGFPGVNENLSQEIGLAPLKQGLTVLAGGVRAGTTWLCDAGLEMTDTRSWAVEVGGLDDQGLARDLLAWYGQVIEYGTGNTMRDYWRHQDAADQLLTTNWEKVRTLAATLLVLNRLTGDQAAESVGLSNPPQCG